MVDVSYTIRYMKELVKVVASHVTVSLPPPDHTHIYNQDLVLYIFIHMDRYRVVF